MPQTLLEQWVSKSTQQRQPTNTSAVISTADGLEQDARNDATSLTTNEDLKQPFTITANRLNPKITLLHPEKDDIARFKRLNTLVLPIPYPDSFYREIIHDEVANSLTLLAFWDATPDTTGRGQLVGAIRCRLLKDDSSNSPLLYISTLVVLAPYRTLGIASGMLDALVRRGFEDYGTTKVGAHVWEANTTGLDWYAKRGFLETGYEKDYYRKLDPHGAKVMSKTISTLDIVKG